MLFLYTLNRPPKKKTTNPQFNPQKSSVFLSQRPVASFHWSLVGQERDSQLENDNPTTHVSSIPPSIPIWPVKPPISHGEKQIVFKNN